MEACLSLSGLEITPTTGDIVLLLGNTGSGKSTFAQFIAGDDSKLKSVKVGAGEYIIEDDAGKIGSSPVSTTLVPELVVDTNYSANIYDCPGFSDTRGVCADVASAYFIRKVVDQAERLKIIFFVNYPSVQKGVDRRDFVHLVQHATKLMRNVRKFNDSIALVVSKVTRETYEDDDGEFRIVPDEEIKRKVVQYLKSVSITLSEQDKTDAVELVRIFLTRNGNDYPKIGLFKRPNKAGVLSNITILQRNKEDLKKILYEYTNFSDRDEGDLSYSITDESKLAIRDMVKIINHNMTFGVREIVSDIKSFIQTKMEQNYDIDGINKTLSDSKILIGRLQDSLKKTKSPPEFITKLSNRTQHMMLSESKLQYLFENSKNWKYFQEVVDEQLEADNRSWLSSFFDLEVYMDSSLKWYSFLIQLYNRLSEYDFQRGLRKLSKSQIENMKIDEILSRLDSWGLYDSRKMLNISFDEMKVRSLKDVLTATLAYNVEFVLTGETLVVKGPFVKLSEVFAHHSSQSKRRAISIFALNTIFIDVDFDRTGEQLQLTLIAPKWYVHGTRKIVLDGAKGESYQYPARSGRQELGGRGQDGLPGLSGYPGGSFLGVAGEVTNGELLTISTNGGEGGDGQMGGQGAVGRDGEDGTRPDWYYGSKSSHGRSRVSTDGTFLGIGSSKRTKVFGVPGEVGGAGGNGGKGGLGGQPGRINVIELNEKSGIKQRAEWGRPGKAGQGGAGGKGGETGRHFIAGCLIILFLPVDCWNSYEYVRSYEFAKTGLYGRTGESELHYDWFDGWMIGRPNPPKFEGERESVETFSRYMETYLDNRASRHRYTSFLGMLKAYLSKH